MSKIVFTPHASGTANFTITSPNSNTNRQVDLPDAAGGVVIDSATQTLTNKTLTSPVLSGTVTGTYTLGGTPTFPAGMVLQVKQTAKTDTTSFVSTSTNAYADITGMSVTITPISTSSKILVLLNIHVSQSTNATTHVRLLRGSTVIGYGDPTGNRLGDTVATRTSGAPYTYEIPNLSMSYLDSPATTSATTYKLQGTLGASYSGTFYLNRTSGDADNSDYVVRTISTITVMEIAG